MKNPQDEVNQSIIRLCEAINERIDALGSVFIIWAMGLTAAVVAHWIFS